MIYFKIFLALLILIPTSIGFNILISRLCSEKVDWNTSQVLLSKISTINFQTLITIVITIFILLSNLSFFIKLGLIVVIVLLHLSITSYSVLNNVVVLDANEGIKFSGKIKKKEKLIGIDVILDLDLNKTDNSIHSIIAINVLTNCNSYINAFSTSQCKNAIKFLKPLLFNPSTCFLIDGIKFKSFDEAFLKLSTNLNIDEEKSNKLYHQICNGENLKL